MIGDSRPNQDRDQGAVLLLVLAVSIVLSLVVLALANFVAADLRYAQVVDGQARRLASAESGIDYALDRLRLNQTLCATDVAAGSSVSLHGSTTGGTPMPSLLNGTDTRVTCQRLDGAIADVAGWAVIISDPLAGGPNDRIRVDGDGTALVTGPVFLPNPNAVQIGSDSIFRLGDADLWYTSAPNCETPKRLSDMPTRLVIGPPDARGPECTTRTWNQTFSAPPVPALPTNIAGDTNGDGVVDQDSDADGRVDGVLVGSCLVFSPGKYTMVPDVPLGTAVYFQSGDYHLDFNDEWTVDDATVWVGRSSYAATIPNSSSCGTARNADVLGGATFYFDRHSRLVVESNGAIEMFERAQGAYSVSVQALTGSTTGSSTSLIHTRPEGEIVIHGLVWAPDGRFEFDNEVVNSIQQLLGGIVVGRLWTLRVYPSGFKIAPATSTVDTRVLLTSTSTLNGVSTTVEAVVAYRPQAASLDNRVAVTSYRVVD